VQRPGRPPRAPADGAAVTPRGALGTSPARPGFGRRLLQLRLAQNLVIPLLGLLGRLPGQGTLPAVKFPQECPHRCCPHRALLHQAVEFPLGMASPMFRLRKVVVRGHRVVNGPPGDVFPYRVGAPPALMPAAAPDLPASSIIRVSATTGERKVLVSDPRYDYHFCAAYSWCDNWYGDWIQVRRFPFEQQTLALFDPATDCLGYGEDCDEPPELFALNWRTGELIPWGEISLSAFTPIPAHPDTADLFVP